MGSAARIRIVPQDTVGIIRIYGHLLHVKARVWRNSMLAETAQTQQCVHSQASMELRTRLASPGRVCVVHAQIWTPRIFPMDLIMPPTTIAAAGIARVGLPHFAWENVRERQKKESLAVRKQRKTFLGICLLKQPIIIVKPCTVFVTLVPIGMRTFPMVRSVP